MDARRPVVRADVAAAPGDVPAPAADLLAGYDVAHVLIGVCRARGIPARYVSGYLLDPDGSGDRSASHAWVDVLDPDGGWISLDPTHDTEQTDHYIRVGVGRDDADVAPMRGVYKGNAAEELDVSVEIVEL